MPSQDSCSVIKASSDISHKPFCHVIPPVLPEDSEETINGPQMWSLTLQYTVSMSVKNKFILLMTQSQECTYSNSKQIEAEMLFSSVTSFQ